MKKISLAAAALCLAVSAAGVPFAATADPMLLTATQLDQVSAGGPLIRLPPINVAVEGVDIGDFTINTQTAVAVAIATAACGFCDAAIADALAGANNTQE